MVILAIVLTLVFWLLTTRSVYGFSVRTVGAAPHAARYGGFDASRTVWSTPSYGAPMRSTARARRRSPQSSERSRASARFTLFRLISALPRSPNRTRS